ncbi:MAG: hypothetical protein ACPGXK_08030 [Phycisphaerae bacterium]
MKKTIVLLPLAVITTGCIDLQLPDVTLLGNGPIAIPGVAAESSDSACPLWIADNGQQYILFQDSVLDSDSFDAVIVPGTISRLVLAGRNDLGEPCVEGAVTAEVRRVIQIEDEPVEDAKIIDLRGRTTELIEDVQNELSMLREEITNNLRETIDDIEARMEERKNQIRDSIDDAFESVSDSLEDRQGIRGRLNEFGDNVSAAVDETVDQIEAAKENLSDNVAARIDALLNEVNVSLDGELIALASRLASVSFDDVEIGDNVQEIIEEASADLTQRLNDKRDEFTARMDELDQLAESAVQSLRDRLIDEITPDLPEPDLDIPPLLDDALPDFSRNLETVAGESETLAETAAIELLEFVEELVSATRDQIVAVFPSADED